ncbi:hypothetical protein LguiA_011308 [Lonicera macranthoides]
MGFKMWQQSEKKQILSNGAFREPFQILSITLLSLLLPLSFLLLARLTTAHYLFTFNTYPTISNPPSLLFSLFLYTYPTLLHPLVSLISVAALVHALTGRVTLSNSGSSPDPPVRPSLYTSWIFLCTLQVCVGLGIEGSIGSGVVGTSAVGYERTLLSKTVFFFGLHETMMYWSRTVVKPVVDDTVFGLAREERWVERVTMAASFGALWWWRLRDEVESLVVVAEVIREVSMSGSLADFVGWWLYYLTVTIGMVRVVKGVIWVGIVLVCRQKKVKGNAGDTIGNEDKV